MSFAQAASHLLSSTALIWSSVEAIAFSQSSVRSVGFGSATQHPGKVRWRASLTASRRVRYVLIRRSSCAVVLLAVLAGCGTATGQPAGSGDTPTSAVSAGPTPLAEHLAAEALDTYGVDEVRITYLDPDGAEHDRVAAGEAAGWTVQLHVAPRRHLGASWASENVPALAEQWPAGTAALEIWVEPTDTVVVARAYPPAADGSDLVRAAVLLGDTPGVVRSVFDGTTADVRVGDPADAAKVGDVAVVHGIAVDAIRSADGEPLLALADVPPRPVPVEVPLPWPDDAAAPDCAAEDLWVELAGSDAATGHRGMALFATNVGGRPCAVEGYPELSFRTLDGRPLDVTTVNGATFMSGDPGAHRIVVPPLARVRAVAGWDAMSTAEDPATGEGPAQTAELVLAVAAGMPPREVPLTSAPPIPELGPSSPPSSFDILDGALVEITAWAPEGQPT